MPSTLTLVGSPTISSIDNAADWFWIWDTSASSLNKVNVSTVFNNFPNILVYANGISGGQSLSGGTAANDDLTLQGTTNATRTTSYVLLQPNGGNVGIGTESPVNLLHLSSDGPVLSLGPTGQSDPRIDFFDTSSTNIAASIFFDLSADALKILRTASGSATDGIIITSSGNVGIGTASPVNLLHLSSDGPVLSLGPTGQSDPRIDFFDTSSTNIAASIFFDLSTDALKILRTASGSATDGIIITSSGNVGIGELTPTAMLQVEQTSATGAKPTLRLQQADVSEEFIRFDTTVGAGNPINDTILGTYYGRVRVFVEGVGAKWLALYN
jgi:hypothetical protein